MAKANKQVARTQQHSEVSHEYHGRKRSALLSGIDKIGIPTKWSDVQILSAFEKAGLFLIGYVGGKEVDRRWVKSGDSTGFKKFVGPLLTLGGGLAVANIKGEVVRYIGYGLMTSGAVTGVNNALGKGKDITDLSTLKGYSLGDLLSGKTEYPVYNDPVELKLPPYKPSLPDLDGSANTTTHETETETQTKTEELNGVSDDEIIV